MVRGAELLGKLLGEGALESIKPRIGICFHQMATQTKAECVYALESSTRLPGIEFVPGNNGTLKIAAYDQSRSEVSPSQ